MNDADRTALDGNSGVDLDAYVPRWVREGLASRSDDRRGSVARQVDAAVLLVDIVGFKALTEELTRIGARGAEALRGVLNRYFGQVSSLVTAHGGDTATFAGDALLAFWTVDVGGPEAACLAAVRCALAVQDAVARLAPQFPAPVRQRWRSTSDSFQLGNSRDRRAALRALDRRPLSVVAKTLPEPPLPRR